MPDDLTAHDAINAVPLLRQWQGLLHTIDVAPSQPRVASAQARAEGWLLGLLDAQVIDAAQLNVLEEEARCRAHAAAVRTA